MLVLDANILMSAVLGKGARALLAKYADRIGFVAPDVAFIEARERLPEVLARRKLPSPWACMAPTGLPIPYPPKYSPSVPRQCGSRLSSHALPQTNRGRNAARRWIPQDDALQSLGPGSPEFRRVSLHRLTN